MAGDWQDQAACRGLPLAMFFPARGEPTEPAKAVCAGCPVREPCLELGLQQHRDDGVWAETAGRGLRKIKSQRAKARHQESVDAS